MIKVKKDLTGKVFGRLTVIKQVEDYITPKGIHHARWLCKCECGNRKKVVGGHLSNGNTKSCGCLSRELTNFFKPKEDLIGQTFGKLTVIKQVKDYISSKGKRSTRWLCECNCEAHNTIEVNSSELKRGKIKSCGCLLGKFLYDDPKLQLNLKDEYGYYGIGHCSNTGKEFYFDMEDYEKIKWYCWQEHKCSVHYSNVSTIIKKNDKNNLPQGKRYSITKMIKGDWYDHIDKNPFNNRNYNLRSCSLQENNYNQPKRSDNTTGFIGVYFDKKKDKWGGRIGKNNKNKFLGYFTNKEDAIRARLQAEKEYFGEFAPQRHLFKEYGIEDDFPKEK